MARPVAQQGRPPCPVNVVHEVSVAVSLLLGCACRKSSAVPMKVDVVELLKRSCGTNAPVEEVVVVITHCTPKVP